MPGRIRWTVLSLVALAAPAWGSRAVAQTFDVKQLAITQGALELGLDNSMHGGVPGQRKAGINRRAHEQSLDWDATDWWRLSGVLKLENPHDQDVRVGSVAVEHLLALRKAPGQGGLGLGWFTALDLSIDQATTNAILFGPIVTLQSGKLSFTGNPFIERTFGRNRHGGAALSYGWQVKYDLSQDFAFGIESFGHVDDLGNSPALRDQQHRIGPVLFTEIKLAENFAIMPDIGILFGLTEATPEVTLKLNVGIPLHAPARK